MKRTSPKFVTITCVYILVFGENLLEMMREGREWFPWRRVGGRKARSRKEKRTRKKKIREEK